MATEANTRFNRLLGYLSDDPKNPRLLVDAADEALRVGEFQVALELLERAAAEDPGNTSLPLKKSNVLLASQQYAPARALLRGVIRDQAASSAAVMFNLAYAELGCSEFEAARQILSEIAPEGRKALPLFDWLLAKALYYSSESRLALEPLRSYLSTSGNSPVEPSLCALMLYDLDPGGRGMAIELAKQALSLEIADPVAHLVMGSLAVDEGEPEAASLHLSSAAQARPEWGRTWSMLGYMELLRVAPAAARPHFETATRLMPDHLGTWHGLAWTCILLQDLPTARKAMHDAMELDRNFAENHGTLAVIDFMEGNIDSAEASVKKGLRLNPKSPASQYARSLILNKKGDANTAGKIVQRILQETGPAYGRLLGGMRKRLEKSGSSKIVTAGPSETRTKH